MVLALEEVVVLPLIPQAVVPQEEMVGCTVQVVAEVEVQMKELVAAKAVTEHKASPLLFLTHNHVLRSLPLR
jgi:hypothetical protein